VIPVAIVFRKLFRAARSAWQDRAFRGLAQLTIVLLLAGTLFYWRVEDWTPLESFYFSVITLTTVGYGDFSPATALGRAFTIAYVLLGLGIVIALVTQIAGHATDSSSRD
jgi:voltage-gated potassium channel